MRGIHCIHSSDDLDSPGTVEFHSDRPFVFLIRDRSTGAILALGRVFDPNAL